MYMAQLRGQKFSIENDIYYTSIEGLTDELLTKTHQIRIIDEAYMAANNLESNLPRVIELGTAMNAIRNRGHCCIFLYSKINRGTKMLLESANFWMHKPEPSWGLLYIRDREFVGSDPWYLEDILKAKKISQKRWLMTHNPNFITEMEMPWIKDSVFNEYEKFKLKHQEDYQHLKMRARESQERQEKILDEMRADYTAAIPKFTMENIKEHLQTKGFSRATARKYANLFKDYIVEEQLVSSQMERMRQASAEEDSSRS